MRKIYLLIAIALIAFNAMAHNPLTAKFELSTSSQDFGLLNIYLSQAGLHEALTHYYHNTDFAKISDKSYKELAVDYIKARTLITVSGVELVISEGGIKLGSHQTDLKFLIKNFPKNGNQIDVKIDAFSENQDHHTMFWWKHNGKKAKLILSEANDFSGTINMDASQPIHLSTLKGKSIYAIIGIITMFFVFYLKSKRQIKHAT